MDDAAGLTIAHSLDSEIASLSQAVRNANDGISLVNLAEGAMDEISAMLTRMKELATQGMNGTYSDADRANLNIEFQALSAEITRITENTFFNGIHVLNSSATTTFQVGDGATDFIAIDYQPMGSAFIGGTVTPNETVAMANTAGSSTAAYVYANAGAPAVTQSTDQLRITVEGRTFVQNAVNASPADTVAALALQISNASIGSLASATANAGVLTITGNTAGDPLSVSAIDRYNRETSGNITSQEITDVASAGRTLGHIESAIEDVDMYRATLGAQANRIQHAASNLMSRVEHQAAARSRIQDADYAVESANLAKAQILQQAGTAMLAQSNASMQNVLELLK
jgi:flagellin